MESSPTNIHKVHKNLLRTFCKFVLLIVLSFNRSLSCVEKIFIEYQTDFCMKIFVTKIPTNLVINSLLSLVCSFAETKIQESNFQQVCSLVTKIVICLWQLVSYFKGIPNSTKFCNRTFLDVIAISVIVLW